jgi:hypothetical protein
MRERRTDGRGGVGQVRADQLAETREVAGSGWSSAGFAVMGAILPYQAECLVENGRRDRLGEQARAARGDRTDRHLRPGRAGQ